MVVVRVPPEQVASAAVQHTGWMLVNLLARMDQVIEKVVVVCEEDAVQAGRIVPFAPDASFRDAVIGAATRIGGVPVELTTRRCKAEIAIELGAGPAVEGAFRAMGDGWWGGITPAAMPTLPASPLPYGPYAGACLAAWRVFWLARAVEPGELVPLGYSMWDLSAGAAADANGPPEVEVARAGSIGLAGVGAVGTAFLHTLWAGPPMPCELTAADADVLGVTESNLNRCVLFGRDMLGLPKATSAADICHDTETRIVPVVGRFEQLASMPQRVVSAVDTSGARRAIQARYPGWVVQASTNGVRAEMLHCHPGTEAACLACFAADDPVVSDAAAQREFLELRPVDQLERIRQFGLDEADAIRWATEGKCGYAGDRLAAHFRSSAGGTRAFSVGFVSVMAGTMLAAQIVREAAGMGSPFDGLRSRAVMSFTDPGTPTNRISAFARDRACGACRPDSAALELWRRRARDSESG